MVLGLMILAGAGLFGCFAAAIGLDMASRTSRARRRLQRPRTVLLRHD